jgi:DNA invertase Pin-like site-specific DNA recombinase
MIVGYARVSTRDQNHDLQIDALRGAGCEKIYEEKLSGALRNRQQLRATIEYVRPGDTLAVWRLDRLARSLKQLIETVEMLSERKIGFRSLTEQIDTTSSGGRPIFHVFGALAEFERSTIWERTTAGLAAARARGRVGGRPRALSDADLSVAKTLLRDGEFTVAEIAGRLNVAPSTLYKHLPRPRSTITLGEPV